MEGGKTGPEGEWHERLPEWLEEASEILDKAERESYIARVCGGDEDRTEEFRELLEEYTFEDGSLVGQRIGPYEIKRPVGEGGMGSVYLAERVADFKQTVAIKVMSRGIVSKETRRRALAEPKIQACLHDCKGVGQADPQRPHETGAPLLHHGLHPR